MKIFQIKRIFIVAFFLIISVCLVSYGILKSKDSDDSFKYNDNGTVALDKDMVSFGVNDSKGNHIDNGSYIEVSGGTLLQTVSLGQNFDTEQQYMLLVFIDFLQSKFIVDNVSCDTYKFSLDSEDAIDINIELDTNVLEGKKKINYVVIRNPDYKPKPTDTDLSQFDIRLVYSTSINIGKEITVNELSKWEKNTIKIDANISPFNLSQNYNNIESKYAFSSCEKSYLLIPSDTYNLGKESFFAVIALQNWNQTSFADDESMVKFFKSDLEKAQAFEVEFSKVESETIYQFIAFPILPNNKSARPIMSQRVIITP